MSDQRQKAFWLFAGELLNLLNCSMSNESVAARLWDEAAVGEKACWNVLDFYPERGG